MIELYEMAILCAFMYGMVDKKSINGFEVVKDLEDEKSGFKATLFKKVDNYVFVFKGSDKPSQGDCAWTGFGPPISLRDHRANVKQALGLRSEQYELAMYYIEIVKDIVLKNNGKLHLAGHSLGGGIASVVGTKHKFPTLTLNASGISNRTLKRYDITRQQAKEFIRAYYIPDELLSYMQDRWCIMPSAIGNRKAIPGRVKKPKRKQRIVLHDEIVFMAEEIKSEEGRNKRGD
ncbi:MAG: hypothetical protein GY679_02035 [Mycoplasma sp.]|nr:hypothetical protein [Mycoplasma sp.]